MKLIVCEALREDIYKDVARVPEVYRQDKRGETVPEGSVRKVQVGAKSTFVILRGDKDSSDATIRLDDKTRTTLGVERGEEAVFDFDTSHLWDNFRWGWKATEIGYQTATRLALLSLLVGAIGLILGLIGLSLAFRN